MSMVGLVIVTHGRLAEEVLRTLESVLGPLEAVEALSTSVSETPESIRTRIEAAVHRVDRGDGALILTDMLGDTATNQSLRIAQATGVEVIAGANVPMLIKLTSARREMDVHSLARFIQRYGREHIFWATEPVERKRNTR